MVQLPHPLESRIETGLREQVAGRVVALNAAFITLEQVQGCVAGARLSVGCTEAGS